MGPVVLTVGVVLGPVWSGNSPNPTFVNIIPDKLCKGTVARINKPFTRNFNN